MAAMLKGKLMALLSSYFADQDRVKVTGWDYDVEQRKCDSMTVL